MQYRNHFLHSLLVCILMIMASCQTDLPKEGSNRIIVLNLQLPSGEEVDYVRSSTTNYQDATEWKLKTLYVYTFSPNEKGTTAYAEKYNITIKEEGEAAPGICTLTSEAKYTLKLPISASTKYMAFIANDYCSTLETTLIKGVSTPDDLRKTFSDKIITGQSSDFLMENPGGLCMTGELTLSDESGQTLSQGGQVSLKRIMARLDVKNYMPEEQQFRLERVRVIYAAGNGAPCGFLFQQKDENGNITAPQGSEGIWKTNMEMEVKQNSIYDRYGYLPYGTARYPDDSWVGETVTEENRGTWYKKVAYLYEFPKSGSRTTPPTLEITYILNTARGTKRVLMRDRYQNNIDIERNHVYTLQIGGAQADGGAVKFTFADQPWQVHVMDVNLNMGKDVTE